MAEGTADHATGKQIPCASLRSSCAKHPGSAHPTAGPERAGPALRLVRSVAASEGSFSCGFTDISSVTRWRGAPLGPTLRPRPNVQVGAVPRRRHGLPRDGLRGATPGADRDEAETRRQAAQSSSVDPADPVLPRRPQWATLGRGPGGRGPSTGCQPRVRNHLLPCLKE